jgi:hypothetical protein
MRRVIAAVAGIVVVLLVVAQFVLPGVAERKLRSDLAREGSGVHVDVRAFPAIKLLWHHADRVELAADRMRAGASGSGQSLGDRLASTRDTGELDVRIGVLDVHLLRMRHLHLHKEGDLLTASVDVRRRDVNVALPRALRVAVSPTDDGLLSVAGETAAFGRRRSASARVVVDDRGRIVLRPSGLLGALVSVPVFGDDRIAVQSVRAEPITRGFTVTGRARLR